MDITVIRPKLTSYQKKMLYGDERFTITEASTKVGKTFSHLWWLFEEALKSEKKGANYWWVAPVYPQAEIAFNRLRRTIAQYHTFVVNISKLSIECPNGAIIVFKSAEKPDNLYGEDVYAVVMDEFTRAREEAWFAIRSTLTATKGKCKLIGNAKGKKNWGYLLGAKARSGEPNYAYHRITAYDAANEGIISIEEIEQAKRDLPERVFKELYLAEPQEDAANPFGYEHIEKCVKPLSNLPTRFYGIDLAKSRDWTVIIGLDERGDVSYFDRFQKDWEQTTDIIIKTIGGNNALIDGTGVGDPIFERVAKRCINAEQIKYTSLSKQQLIEGLAVAIQRGEVSIINGILRDELEAFEFVYSTSGVKYSAPQGFTDDCVNALAMANRCKQFKVVRSVYVKRNSLI
jgi:hypothetical protein